MGVSRENALAALRLSLGRYTTDRQIDMAVAEITRVVSRAKNIEPQQSKPKLARIRRRQSQPANSSAN
jgi:cysteine sulfinate desulfinase/cysteine desulfurase-like protein